jgi:hypothetical protein
MLLAAAIGLGLVLNEGYFSGRRVAIREHALALARRRSKETGKPLIVVGAPDIGPTMGPSCGDLTLDIQPTSCPRALQVDISRPIPLPSNVGVVLVTCVLEVVDDYDSAMSELERISGGDLFVVRVEPWTLTAHLYPGARRTVDNRYVVEAPPRWRRIVPR